MILSTSVRPQSTRRVVEAAANTFSLFPLRNGSLNSPRRRHQHSVPELAHHGDFSENGIGKMLSPEGYHRAWLQKQQNTINKINMMTDGTADHTATTYALAMRYARSGAHASLFNHASYAHNNHIFFSSVSNSPKAPTQPFAHEISRSFSSPSHLRLSMTAMASGMFGPGFVWLLYKKDHAYASYGEDSGTGGQLALLATYIAGSPYPAAHWRQQGVDMNTHALPVQGGTSPAVYAQQRGTEGAAAYGLFGGFGQAPQTQTQGVGRRAAGGHVLAPGGADVEVLLCVNTWEHVWVGDHGVGGKNRFLQEWWDCVDWSVVEGRWSSVSQRDTGARGYASNFGGASVGGGTGLGVGMP